MGRTALITGANHGIGAAIAVELAWLGSNVVVTFFRSVPSTAEREQRSGSVYDAQRRQDASAVVEMIEQHEARCLAVETDLTVSGAPAHVFEEAEATLGSVSILVNNASGWRQDSFSGVASDPLGRPTEEVSAASFDANFAVDARAGALLIAEFARRHRQNGGTWGRIIALTSGGPTGFPNEVSYGAAKAALENYTVSAATELARDGITANIVHPPITDTGWVTAEVRRFADARGARVAEPAQVAEVVGWLCTDAANLVTGNRIRLS